MRILGINAYHGDASAALVIDGRLVAAVEEERFNRIKHWAGFPAESVRYCLGFADLSIDDVDHVAISFDPRANLYRRVGFVLSQQPSISAIWNRLKRQGRVMGLRAQLADACGCSESDIRAPIHRVEHHMAHVFSSFHVSPFEEAAILSVDGMGDFVSTLTAHGKGTGCETLDRVYYPHSLGFLYNALTLYLGFPAYGDEYKVMGLAPYGKPRFIETFRKIVFPKGDAFELDMEYFTHHRHGIAMTWENGAPIVRPFHSARLESELGPPREPMSEVTERDQDIAASLQAVTEEILFHLLTRLHERTGCERVCIAGGVAMNSVANGKVTLKTPFKEVYVPGGAADNGTSFGAAFYVWHRILGNARSFVLDHAYWGWEAPDRACVDAIHAADLPHESMAEGALLERVVSALCEGQVIGWFRGRMEFGARALGNRSLLADPRRGDMRDVINLKIKFREKFRPFAPSILEERVSEYFEIDAPSPFMEKVFQVRADKRAVIPAVTHVDGSGRLQTVSRRTNPQYWALIKGFEKRTGVPVLLNTSLNENEPIVRTPQEAISCFLRTRMDALVLGNHFVTRREGGRDSAGA